MLIVLEAGATQPQIERVLAELGALELRGELLRGLEKPMIHIVDGSGRQARKILHLEGVQALVRTSGPRIRTRGRHFFPYHLLNWGSVALLALALLVLQAGFDPPGVGVEVDPYGPESDVLIPWYLRAPALLLAHGRGGMLALGGLIAAAFALPLLDRTRGTSPTARLPLIAAGLIFIAACFLLPLL